jgi:hypothetical protein
VIGKTENPKTLPLIALMTLIGAKGEADEKCCETGPKNPYRGSRRMDADQLKNRHTPAML